MLKDCTIGFSYEKVVENIYLTLFFKNLINNLCGHSLEII